MWVDGRIDDAMSWTVVGLTDNAKARLWRAWEYERVPSIIGSECILERAKLYIIIQTRSHYDDGHMSRLLVCLIKPPCFWLLLVKATLCLLVDPKFFRLDQALAVNLVWPCVSAHVV